MSYRVIWASEIGEYLYCQRSWWLRRTLGRQAQSSAGLARGTVFHNAKGRAVRRASALQLIALVFIFLAVGVLVYWLVGLT